MSHPFPRVDGRSVPRVGQYPMVASRMTAPASRAIMGYGPSQFLGVFDTRPTEAPYQPEVHRALQPVPMNGGVTLRWCAPRSTRNQAGNVQTLNPSFQNAVALTLYVGGLDVLPDTQDWRSADWPGWPAGASRFAFAKLPTPNLPSIWQAGLAYTNPSMVGQGTLAPGPAGQFGLLEAQSGFDWMRLVGAMPALDLLSYAGAPWSVADLHELAGGTRYVAAWLRCWWPRTDGVDELADVNYRIPWSVSEGRPLDACHRHAWHLSLPLMPRSIATADDVYADGARFQVSSPIGGRWRVGAENNGDLGDGPVTIGLELRGSVVLSRDRMGVSPTDHGLTIGPTAAHGGAAVLCMGVVGAGELDACLVHVAVSGLA